MIENEQKEPHAPGEHCGIFTNPGEIPILGAHRASWTAIRGSSPSIRLERPAKRALIAASSNRHCQSSPLRP